MGQASLLSSAVRESRRMQEEGVDYQEAFNRILNSPRYSALFEDADEQDMENLMVTIQASGY